VDGLVGLAGFARGGCRLGERLEIVGGLSQGCQAAAATERKRESATKKESA
jgi:hypothetical protein